MNHQANNMQDRPWLDPTALPGQDIGEFRISELLGRGRNSVVYSARNRVLDRSFALKLPIGPPTADTLGRLWCEARAGFGLLHRNIVQVCMAGRNSVGGSGPWLPWIARDLVDGRTLAQIVLEEGRFRVPRAVRVMIDVLGALDYAHGRGVIHGDVTPARILLERNGATRVSGFGQAAGRTPGEAPGEPASDAFLSADDESVRLDPVELLPMRQIDGRADVYGCGVTLAQLLTGDLLWPSSAHSRTDVPVIPALWRIVDRMTAPQPDDRFPSAEHARKALLEWMRQSGSSTDRRTGRRGDESARARRERRVLLSEPAGRDHTSMRRVLELSGFRVMVAQDEAMLARLLGSGATPPAAVVFDPAVTRHGIDLVAEFRACWPDAPLIVLANGTGHADRLQALMTGADRCVVRPCSPVKIAKELCKLLDIASSEVLSASASDTRQMGATINGTP